MEQKTHETKTTAYAILLLLAATIAYSQPLIPGIQVFGTVRDPDGNTIEGAHVSIYDEVGQKLWTGITQADGTYLTDHLPEMQDGEKITAKTAHSNMEGSAAAVYDSMVGVIEIDVTIYPPTPIRRKKSTPEVEITNIDAPESHPGDTTEITVTITNKGTADDRNVDVYLEDTLPDWLWDRKTIDRLREEETTEVGISLRTPPNTEPGRYKIRVKVEGRSSDEEEVEIVVAGPEITTTTTQSEITTTKKKKTSSATSTTSSATSTTSSSTTSTTILPSEEEKNVPAGKFTGLSKTGGSDRGGIWQALKKTTYAIIILFAVLVCIYVLITKRKRR